MLGVIFESTEPILKIVSRSVAVLSLNAIGKGEEGRATSHATTSLG